MRDASQIFTRLLAPLVAQLCMEGIRCLIYIDNFFLMAVSKQLTLEQEKSVFKLFGKCSWVFNPAMRSGEPHKYASSWG